MQTRSARSNYRVQLLRFSTQFNSPCKICDLVTGAVSTPDVVSREQLKEKVTAQTYRSSPSAPCNLCQSCKPHQPSGCHRTSPSLQRALLFGVASGANLANLARTLFEDEVPFCYACTKCGTRLRVAREGGRGFVFPCCLCSLYSCAIFLAVAVLIVLVVLLCSVYCCVYYCREDRDE